METTKKQRYVVSPEVKEQILKRIKDDGISVSQLSEEHGISAPVIYGWLSRRAISPSWQELSKLRKQNQELLALIGELTLRLSQTQKKI